MAFSEQMLSSRLLEELKCDICTYHFNEEINVPRSLYCGHTLCSVCIQAIISSNALMAVCPKCREPLIAKSISEFTINYALLQVVSLFSLRNKNLIDELKLKYSAAMYKIDELGLENDLLIIKNNLQRLENIEKESNEAKSSFLGQAKTEFEALKSFNKQYLIDLVQNPKNKGCDLMIEIYQKILSGRNCWVAHFKNEELFFAKISVYCECVQIFPFDVVLPDQKDFVLWSDAFTVCLSNSKALISVFLMGDLRKEIVCSMYDIQSAALFFEFISTTNQKPIYFESKQSEQFVSSQYKVYNNLQGSVVEEKEKLYELLVLQLNSIDSIQLYQGFNKEISLMFPDCRPFKTENKPSKDKLVPTLGSIDNMEGVLSFFGPPPSLENAISCQCIVSHLIPVMIKYNQMDDKTGI